MVRNYTNKIHFGDLRFKLPIILLLCTISFSACIPKKEAPKRTKKVPPNAELLQSRIDHPPKVWTKEKIQELIRRNKGDISELEGLDIYPAIRKVYEMDKEFFPGVIRHLKEPGWKTEKIGQIQYFYTIEKNKLLDLAQEAQKGLKKIQELLQLNDKTIQEIPINCFITSSLDLKNLTPASALYYEGTSQIYIRQYPSGLTPNLLNETLMQLVASRVWSDYKTPLWVQHGIGGLMYDKVFLRNTWGQKTIDISIWHRLPSLSREKLIPLKQLLEKEAPRNFPFFKLESVFLMQFLSQKFGPHNVVEFIRSYLHPKTAPSIPDFKNAYSRLEGSPSSLKEIEKTFFDFLIQKFQGFKKIPRGTDLVFNTTEHAFGTTTNPEKDLEYTFIATNTSQETIYLDAMAEECKCSVSSISQRRLKPNEVSKIKITAPAYDSQPYSCKFTVVYEGPYSANRQTLFIQAN